LTFEILYEVVAAWGRVDVNRTNESRGLTDFMGTLHNIQK
jgi:hypothetical protein